MSAESTKSVPVRWTRAVRTTIVRTGIGCLLVGPLIAGFEIVAAAGTRESQPHRAHPSSSATSSAQPSGPARYSASSTSNGGRSRKVMPAAVWASSAPWCRPSWKDSTSSGYWRHRCPSLPTDSAVESFDGLLECDYQPAVDAGYGLLFEASVMVGVTYPFVEPVFLAGDSPAAPELIAVGDTSSGDAMYYEPTALPSLPPLPGNSTRCEHDHAGILPAGRCSAAERPPTRPLSAKRSPTATAGSAEPNGRELFSASSTSEGASSRSTPAAASASSGRSCRRRPMA